MIVQKLQAHSQVYVNGKIFNLEKAPGRQVAVERKGEWKTK